MNAYHIATRGIADLHHLASQGLEDSPQAQAIHHRLERPLLSMSEKQLARLDRFGKRLDREVDPRLLARVVTGC